MRLISVYFSASLILISLLCLQSYHLDNLKGFSKEELSSLKEHAKKIIEHANSNSSLKIWKEYYLIGEIMRNKSSVNTNFIGLENGPDGIKIKYGNAQGHFGGNTINLQGSAHKFVTQNFYESVAVNASSEIWEKITSSCYGYSLSDYYWLTKGDCGKNHVKVIDYRTCGAKFVSTFKVIEFGDNYLVKLEDPGEESVKFYEEKCVDVKKEEKPEEIQGFMHEEL